MTNGIQGTTDGTFYMVMKAGMNVPGVQIKRNDFLRKELSKKYDSSIVDLAIKKNPAYAGISTDELEAIALSCINYESHRVTAISAIAGIPGGVAMLGTVPGDTAQYFAHIVRILQKLIYLYGWEELYNKDGDFDDETLNQLTLFIGVMFGVNAANATVTKLSQSAAIKVEKSLANKALTKGTIYPIVKKVAGLLGLKMTKGTFAKGVGKAVPIVGGLASGGMTYVSFRPLAIKLKDYLKELPIADVNFYKEEHNDVIDIDFNEIMDCDDTE